MRMLAPKFATPQNNIHTKAKSAKKTICRDPLNPLAGHADLLRVFLTIEGGNL
jgi:hypothetical protein